MKRLLGLLLATALVAGCGGGGGADLSTVAGAIREVEQKGAAFTYTDTLLDSGGSIPKGVTNRIRLSGAGQERDDNASLVLSQLDSAGKAVGAWDLVINDVYLFVRPHGTTRDWFLGSAAVFNQFYPGVRLNLLPGDGAARHQEQQGGQLRERRLLQPVHDHGGPRPARAAAVGHGGPGQGGRPSSSRPARRSPPT